MDSKHSLLMRQLKELNSDDLPPGWLAFVEAVNRAYHQFDDDRMLLERAMELSSQELLQANAERLAASENRFLTTFDQAAVGLAHVAPGGQLLLVNRRLCEMFGYTESELRGRRIGDLAMPEDASSSRELESRLRLREIGEFVVQKRYLRRDGSPLWVNLKVVRVDARGQESEYDIAVLEDITARKQFEVELQRLARYDALCGLPNRLMLQDRLRDGLARARRGSVPLGFILLDIDRFKEVNDTHGHLAGDELLVEVASRLSSSFRDTDTVARLGGDEFTVLLEGCESVDELSAVVGRLPRAFHRPFVIAGRSIPVTMSAGVSLFPHDGQSFERLLHCADMAMYRAKREGGGVRYFAPSQAASG